jgi:hypothetical protein
MEFSAHHAHRWVFAAAVPGNAIAIDECAIIAVKLSSLLHPEPTSSATIERDGGRSGIVPATVVAQFSPLDCNVVNEAIPAFFVGRNNEGLWVARDVTGRIGGIFLLENSAVSFARRNSQPTGCATIFPTERFELDIENSGSPLAGLVGSLIRLTSGPRRQIAATIGKMAEAAKRRLRAFPLL